MTTLLHFFYKIVGNVTSIFFQVLGQDIFLSSVLLFGNFLFLKQSQENALTCARDYVPLRNDFRAKKMVRDSNPASSESGSADQPEQEIGRDDGCCSSCATGRSIHGSSSLWRRKQWKKKKKMLKKTCVCVCVRAWE
jgi:hypothetical protein